jgi:putative transposase
MRSPAADVSGFWPSATTSPVNAWRSSPISPCHCRSTGDVRVQQRTELTGTTALRLPGEADRRARDRARQAGSERVHRDTFNACLRDELLNETLFTSLAQVQACWHLERGLPQRPAGHASSNLTPTEHADRSAQDRNGRGAALHGKLRGPPRCSTEPHGLKYRRTLPIVG